MKLDSEFLKKLNAIEIEDNFSKNLEIYFKKLSELNEKLSKLREEIRNDKLKNFTTKEIKSFRVRLKEAYKEQDRLIENSEELSLEEKEHVYANPKYIKIVSMKLDNQILIGRIVNKVQKEEAERINGRNEALKQDTESISQNIEKMYGDVKKVTSESQGNILTVSSLIFTAFTVIQLNFVAFENSNSYNVLDRIILFSGINIFALLGIFAVFSLIKSLTTKEEEKVVDSFKSIFKRPELCIVTVVIIILTVFFIIALYLKNSQEKIFEKKLETLDELKISSENGNERMFDIIEKNKKLEKQLQELEIELKKQNIEHHKSILDLKEEILDLNNMKKD